MIIIFFPSLNLQNITSLSMVETIVGVNTHPTLSP
jgi:hypothetical protein